MPRNENATLKKLRKQQETSLSEMLAHKEELLQWVTDEKARTAAWCGEQRQMAMKERNAAAKLARDSRQRALSSSLPVRKEKSELEALHATIEKMKIDHEVAAKKSKANEHRLYSLVKDHTTHLESNEKQLLSLEQDKLMLLEFISEQGIRLPKSLRGLLQKGVGSSGSSTGQHAGSSGASKTSGGRYRTDNRNGYVEEVDVEDVGVTSKTALVLDDETESGWNRRSTDRQSGSSQRNAVVGKLGSDKSPNLSSTLPSSRHSAKAAERHELIHPTQSRPSNEAKIVDNNKFRPLTSSTTDSRNSAAPNHRVGEDAPKSRINDSSATTGDTSHASSDGQSKQSADPNRIEEILPNGTKVIRYKNGTLKEVDPSGSSIVRFLNGDSKQYKADSGVVVYYYALADTTHTTHPDGLEIYEFPNKQASCASAVVLNSKSNCHLSIDCPSRLRSISPVA